MLLFCFLFGLTLIAQTQGAGDGGWFWYASLLHDGHRLYSQMHLALQPLFVLETDAFQALLGKGWVISKVPAILHVIAYCTALRVLVRRSNFTDAQKAVVIGCGFFFPLGFEAYRFDDYHVLADCFELYSLIALFALPEVSRLRSQFFLISSLGVLCGLSITTRLNDGAALFIGLVLGVAVLAPRRRLASLALFSLGVALTVVLVVRCTGDSLNDWATYSVFHAANSKGGTSRVLAYPIFLPLAAAQWLVLQHHYDRLIAYIFLCALAWALLLRPLIHRHGPREFATAVAGVLLVLLPWPWMRADFLYTSPTISFPPPLLSVAAVITVFACMLGALIPVRLLRWLSRSTHPYQWDGREILLLVPIGQMASGSMSSGGFYFGLYNTIGVLVVLLSICPPFHFKRQWPRSSAVAVMAILVANTALFKVADPFSWHTYREAPLFTGRTWYRHPVYGPMIIDKDLLALVQPVCSAIGSSGSRPELVSLPFPYANYFCVTPPWGDYVQTFFDMAGTETVQGLMDRLDSAPPTWVLYQRQLATLHLHERIFNHGQPLQHRYLDQMIERKIADGSWRVVYISSYRDTPGWDNHWLLIRTAP